MNDLSETDLFETDGASTPLTADEKNGLIPTHITLRRELNEIEHAGIVTAYAWAFSRKRNVLDEKFLRRLHREMFRNVWRWAGEYSRETGRNIGVDSYRIVPELHQLLDDVKYWVQHNTYPPDEIAIRFHHRLVLIHPFPNGNGRHARLAADLLAQQLGRPRFTWGHENIEAVGSDIRKNYVAALRAADGHDIAPPAGFCAVVNKGRRVLPSPVVLGPGGFVFCRSRFFIYGRRRWREGVFLDAEIKALIRQRLHCGRIVRCILRGRGFFLLARLQLMFLLGLDCKAALAFLVRFHEVLLDIQRIGVAELLVAFLDGGDDETMRGRDLGLRNGTVC